MNHRQHQPRRRVFRRNANGGNGGTARMVRGATVGAALPVHVFPETVLGGGASLGVELGGDTHQRRMDRQRNQMNQQGRGDGEDKQEQPEDKQEEEHQQQQQQQQQQQEERSFDAAVHQPPADANDVVEPTEELDAMVLDRVSRMVLGDDACTVTSSTIGSGNIGVQVGSEKESSEETTTANRTTTSAAATAAIARPPARLFRVRTPTTTNQPVMGIDDGRQQQTSKTLASIKNNKRGATEMTLTPVINNQTVRPSSNDDKTPPQTTNDVADNMASHPLLLLGTGSTLGLLPRLSPPLGLQSPITGGGCIAHDKSMGIANTSCSASSSPTSTTATPTVMAEMLNTTCTTTTSTLCTSHLQLSADGTSLTIDGGESGGRKRRMLKKRHRRTHASLIAGAGAGFGCGSSVVAEGVGGCLGSILPDLADMLDGACGGYSHHGGSIGNTHPLEVCGDDRGDCVGGSSFPDPFGLVTKARRSTAASPRPPNTGTTVDSVGSSGAGCSGLSSRSRSTSPVPRQLARSKVRPSAPTPPGTSMMSQSSSVFNERLDRLASGIKLPNATKGRSGGTDANRPNPPNLVPKFRASPLSFSATLHVTPQPRREAGSTQSTQSKSFAASGGDRNDTIGRRVRAGAKSHRSNVGTTVSASTGFGRSAALAAPSSSSRGSTSVPPTGHGETISVQPPTPSETCFEPIGDQSNACTKRQGKHGAVSNVFLSLTVPESLITMP